MSDLIVMSFSSVATAEEVRDKIRALQKQGWDFWSWPVAAGGEAKS